MIKHKTCKIEGCNNPVWAKGLCKSHTANKPIANKSSIHIGNTGELEERYAMGNFFDGLWAKLPKDKFCTACGKPIYGENLSIYWHHCLPKAQYEEFKYDSRNIIFICGDCHTEIEGGFPPAKAKRMIDKIKKELLND